MENIKAIFLDLGGTFRIVEENEPFYHAARVRIAEICGTDMDPDAYYDFLNRRYDEYRKWALRFMCEAPEKVLWTRWLVPELDREYIELRARGYKVGIISDLVGTVEIDEWLDKDGIRDLFCTVQQSSVTMLRKPHPAIYYLALDEAGVRPEDSVFVGDNLKRDILGAKQTGFAGTVAADYPGGLPMTFNEENKPDCFIHHFNELLDLFPGEGKYLPERGERRD